MAYLEIKHLNFTYAGADEAALCDVSLCVEQGDFVVLCGASGCGKTTLLRLLKRQMSPNGKQSGSIRLDGQELDALDERQSVAEVGFVSQHPSEQIVTDKVWHELAFGLESLGESSSVIRRRVAEIAGFFGIGDLYHRATAELSGGQKQLLNLASVMVMQPRLLVLDEPTAQLDPIAAAEFLSSLKKINEELGVTVILAEHRLEEAFPMADRVVLMDRARVRAVTTPRELCEHIDADEATALGLPSAVRVFRTLKGTGECPLTVREGKRFVTSQYADRIRCLPEPPHREGETVMEAREVWFRYERSTPDVLRGLSLTLQKGEHLCVLGANGAGKTTLLRVLAGLSRPYRGKVLRGVRSALLPQDPRSLFVTSSVMEDWIKTASATGQDAKTARARAEELSDRLGVFSLADRHPYDLSGGEAQKAAFVKLLLADPDVLLLDEPTKGLDARSKQQLADTVDLLTEQGKTVVCVTHDVEFAAEHADRCAMFFDGQIVAVEDRIAFFAHNAYYTTAASRMSRPHYENAVTVDMLVALCRENGQREEERDA